MLRTAPPAANGSHVYTYWIGKCQIGFHSTTVAIAPLLLLLLLLASLDAPEKLIFFFQISTFILVPCFVHRSPSA